MRNSNRTFVTRVGFDALLNGQDVSIEFDRHTELSFDSNYGADADGRRGMPMTFIDEDYATDITVDGVPANDWFEIRGENTNILQSTVDIWLSLHEPEIPEEPEPDYDDIDD